MAREMLMPMLFKAKAAKRSFFSTSDGTIACHAGIKTATPDPRIKVIINNIRGVMAPEFTTKPRENAVPARKKVAASISFRRFKISANAPAGRANRNIGNVDRAWTSATRVGESVKVVISQPDETSCIQVPTLETRPAVQISANAPYPNGAQGLLFSGAFRALAIPG